MSFLIIFTLHADDATLASGIFNTICTEVTHRIEPKVYMHGNILALQKYPGDLEIVQNCMQADMVILTSTKNIPDECSGKILFGTKYSHLKYKGVIGAFFWQKGRPNILFYKEKLLENKVYLDSKLEKYID